MDFQLPARPELRSKTRRRAWRRDVRQYLGTSSQDVPTLPRVLRAVNALNNLLQLSSEYRYTIVIRHLDGETETPSAALRREERMRGDYYALHGRYVSND